MSNAESPASAPPARLASIDAYRGLVMLLLLGEMLHTRVVAKALPDCEFWKIVSYHQSHVEWVGCSLHDLIQPGFSFLVGVALPFSIASRLARGDSQLKMTAHAVWRAFVLVFLGVFLRSMGKPQTNFTFEDTLSQIGLGYVFLFLLGLRSARVQWAAFWLILVGYWAAFALYPLPGADFDFKSAGVPENWPEHLRGFAAHWNKNSNPAWAFDTWFMNLFPRPKPFVANGGGYSTLSFIPTLATMILGLRAGEVLRSERTPRARVAWLVSAGALTLLAGWLMGWLGICPVVKRIWTPSWVLFSGGWCFWMLAGFYALTDAIGWKGWAFPLVVIGANSIAAYLMHYLFPGFIQSSLTIHLGKEAFRVFGQPYEPIVRGTAVLLVFWLALYWMYRRKVFLKI